MSITHKATLVMSSLVAFTLLVGPSTAGAQGSNTSQQAQQQAQVAQGELLSVDASAKVLTIKPAQGAEQKFQYTEQTKVTGARGGVAGLATMGGRQIVVHFTAQGANRVATEIELQPEK
jgi:hypothetical protein